jgi:hypothetical protein
MTSPLPQWCKNAAFSLTRTSACDITLTLSLRDASLRSTSHVSVPMISLVTSQILSRLDYCKCVLFGLPYVLISLVQSFQKSAAGIVFNLRRTACMPTSPTPRSASSACRYLSARASKSRYWYIARCKGHGRILSDLHPNIGDRGTLQPALGLTSPTGRSSLPSLQLERPCISGFGRHCLERISNGNHLSSSSLSIFRSPENLPVLSLISRRCRLVFNSLCVNRTSFSLKIRPSVVSV